MKIKSFIASALLMSSLSSFAVDITLSPLYSAIGVVKSAVVTAASSLAATTGSSVITSGNQKKQLAAVRADAINFLAGDEASRPLISSISEVRKNSEELNELSDTQIASLIITALE